MNDEYQVLSYGQVALAASLVLLNAAISLALRLGLERSLVVASVRAVAQLLLVGLLLTWVFAVSSAPLVVALMATMTLIAGIAAVRRVDRRFAGIWLDSILSVWASAWCVAAFGIFAVVRVEPWYEPQYTIPLLGMILGNTLNGISLALARLGEDLVARRDEVETYLALGATRWEAAGPSIRGAVSTGMIPTINAMMVLGLVSLPGMMTGQLLSGVDPIEAVKYQIVIIFLIAAGTALGTVSVVLLAYRRLFNADHQFLVGKIFDRR